MKKIALFLLLTCFFAKGQESISVKKFNSALLNTERYLKIYVPDSYAANPNNTYPVAIVLDAEYLFDIYVANAKVFAAEKNAPEQIVVGIFQNQEGERTNDCDFSVDTGLPTEESTRFYGFIRQELINFIDDNYRTSLFKTIVGNTLTANFANYFFLEPNHIFNAYILINPTTHISMPEKLEAKSQSLTDQVFYYLCNSNNNNADNKKEINNINNLLKLSEVESFHYKFENFENSSKPAMIGQAIPSAMDMIFGLFSSISKEEFDTNIADLSPPEAIAYLEKKYVEIEEYKDDMAIVQAYKQAIDKIKENIDLDALEIEIEYQANSISKYALSFNGSSFQLIATQTNCLAPDQCGIPTQKTKKPSTRHYQWKRFKVSSESVWNFFGHTTGS